MRLFYKGKDGGPDSPVTGYWLIEIKSLFSIVLLKFNPGRRETYHTHAFNALTWWLKGTIREERVVSCIKKGFVYRWYKPSLKPKYTPRSNLHRIYSPKISWCLSIRGPWSKTWTEYDENTDKTTVLSSGRKIVDTKTFL